MRSLLSAAVLIALGATACADVLSEADSLLGRGPGYVCERGEESYASRQAGRGCVAVASFQEAQQVAAKRSSDAFNARERTTLIWAGAIGLAAVWWLAGLLRRRKRQIAVGAAEIAGNAVGKAANVAESTAHAAGAASVKVEQAASTLVSAFRRGRECARRQR